MIKRNAGFIARSFNAEYEQVTRGNDFYNRVGYLLYNNKLSIFRLQLASQHRSIVQVTVAHLTGYSAILTFREELHLHDHY